MKSTLVEPIVDMFGACTSEANPVSPANDGWIWPPEGWSDIQQIADSEKNDTYSVVLLFDNNIQTLNYESPVSITSIKTSDGSVYNSTVISHTWDPSKDINGKYRYIIISINNNWNWHKHPHAIGIAYSSNYMVDKTDFRWLFEECCALQTIPMLDVSAGTSFSYMFQDCYSLQYVPPLDFSNGVDFLYTFAGCRSLKKIPQFDLSNAENLRSFLMSCSNLEEIPLMDTSKCTNFDYFARECSALKVFPELDTSQMTTARGMFSYGKALAQIGPIDVSQCTDFEEMFQYCMTLPVLSVFDVSAGTVFTSMFSGCNSLTSIGGNGVFNGSIDLGDTILNKDSIVGIFNNLPVTTDQTITISSYTDGFLEETDKLIATNKGWTIAVQ